MQCERERKRQAHPMLSLETVPAAILAFIEGHVLCVVLPCALCRKRLPGMFTSGPPCPPAGCPRGSRAGADEQTECTLHTRHTLEWQVIRSQCLRGHQREKSRALH